MKFSKSAVEMIPVELIPERYKLSNSFLFITQIVEVNPDL